MKCVLHVFAIGSLALGLVGCRTPLEYRKQADDVAEKALAEAQEKTGSEIEAIEIDSPATSLRKRLLLDQLLIHGSPASSGVRDLPDNEFWHQAEHFSTPPEELPPPWEGGETVTVTLLQALQVCARNSRDYQSAKEDLYRAALALDLERKDFRNTFSGMLRQFFQSTDNGSGRVNAGVTSGDFGVKRVFRNGAELSSAIAVDLAKLLTQDHSSSWGLYADTSISIPLLRGSSEIVVTESLTQAERNLLYEVYDFERFKRTFMVRVASEYFAVLRDEQQVVNQRESYRRLVASTRRAKRLADSGRLPEFQFSQSIQNELRARSNWIRALQGHESALDSFKVLLGLPPDARVALTSSELVTMGSRVSELIQGVTVADYSGDVPPADAPVELDPPSRENGGVFEIDPAVAVKIALENRLDLRRSKEEVWDAQRRVLVAADNLRGELTLFGKTSIGEGRGTSSTGSPNARLAPKEMPIEGLLTLDLPIERTSERNSYRNRLIDLNRAVRSYQKLEDDVKLQVRGQLRTLLEARENVVIQSEAVKLAEQSVKSTDMFLQAGRAEIRDVLDAEDDLLSARNSLDSALVNYRIAELAIQRDLGVLRVRVDGTWQEFVPPTKSE
jgi:outer membrane protein TolC